MNTEDRILEIAEEVYRTHRKLMIKSMSPNDLPRIEIYMREDYWNDCMVIPQGEVSPATWEFIETYRRTLGGTKEPEGQTLLGYPVFRVISDTHPPYAIRYDMPSLLF